jgi:O-antigen/teichoic acid export membrane protein
MTQLVSKSDEINLIKFYHKSSQLMSILVIPISLFIAFFSYDIIILWTGNEITAKNTHSIVSILICGTAINGLMNVPYALQLAYGWTKLNFFTNFVALIVICPLTYYLTLYYGLSGAALSWFFLNIGYFLILIPLMHVKILRDEKLKWYLNDVIFPGVTCFLILFLGKQILSLNYFYNFRLILIALLGFIAFISTLFILPTMRNMLFLIFKNR